MARFMRKAMRGLGQGMQQFGNTMTQVALMNADDERKQRLLALQDELATKRETAMAGINHGYRMAELGQSAKNQQELLGVQQQGNIDLAKINNQSAIDLAGLNNASLERRTEATNAAKIKAAMFGATSGSGKVVPDKVSTVRDADDNPMVQITNEDGSFALISLDDYQARNDWLKKTGGAGSPPPADPGTAAPAVPRPARTTAAVPAPPTATAPPKSATTNQPTKEQLDNMAIAMMEPTIGTASRVSPRMDDKTLVEKRNDATRFIAQIQKQLPRVEKGTPMYEAMLQRLQSHQQTVEMANAYLQRGNRNKGQTLANMFRG